eukprot:1181704-Amphidinium_carterae.4
MVLAHSRFLRKKTSGSKTSKKTPLVARVLGFEYQTVAALGNRKIFILGDWNFAPDDFPIDHLNGGQVNRPLSSVRDTSPQGEVHTDWILCSKALLPACGLEEETDKKPDHLVIKMEFQLDLVSQGYMGQKGYETGDKTDTLYVEIAVEYQKQRDKQLAHWSSALMRQDVDMLWQLLCRAAEQALGLPPL